MAWVYICLVWFPLASIFGFILHSPNDFDFHSRNSIDRVRNERSILNTSNKDGVEPRNGSTFQNYPFLKMDSGKSRKLDHPIASNKVETPDISFRKLSFVPDIPPDCEYLGYCENIPNYPQAYVDDLIAKTPDVKFRFNLDLPIQQAEQRLGPEEDNIELCQHTVKVIYPSAAKNTRGRWVMVVNNKEKPVQGYKSEICTKPEGPCSDIAYFPPEKYKPTCHQKISTRTIWTLDSKGAMVLEDLPIASCCTCVVKLINP